MQKLLEIMSRLRDPQTGCPWDIKQTFASIVPYTLEEAYEVADAIENGSMQELKSELGDLLFQVVFYAQMAAEQGEFDFHGVVEDVSEKLIRRHPHVFAGQRFASDAELNEAWEAGKAEERDLSAKQQGDVAQTGASLLSGVALALPALKRAQKLQKRAARAGFDWPDAAPVLEKIEEEVEELKAAMAEQNSAAITEEMGDLLFSCVNLSRHLGVDAEESLRQSNHKFEQRFAYIENQLSEQQRAFAEVSLDQLEALWQQAKRLGESP